MPESPASALLQMRGISKSFPGVKALSAVDFTLGAGEVHALMGENGAGKSTLIKVLTGVYPRDSGEIILAGRQISPRAPAEAEASGISTVYQEVNLIPYLSVAENICLGRQPMRFGFVDWRAIRKRAENALSRLGISIDVRERLTSYSIAIQQLVAIARAVDVAAKVLVLDEPTSSLDAHEVERLFAIMRRLKTQGLGIVFVTHFLDQVYGVSDRITVLRNGKLVGEFEAASLPRIQLVSKMMGKDMSELDFKASTRESTRSSTTPVVALANVSRKRSVENISLEIFSGETLGLAGLLGSGRTETARIVFGLDHPDDGEMRIDGTPQKMRSPLQAICRRFGFCPEDRKVEGIVPNLSIRENIIVALQSRRGWWKFIGRAEQLQLARECIKALNIVTPGPEQPIRLLSGGNQQKVILARWLTSQPRVLLLDEPTRGIDVGAKLEIEKLMARLAKEGMAILLISSDLEELVRNSHRVVVLRDRRKVGELAGTAVTEPNIMQAIAAPAPSENQPAQAFRA